MFQRLSGWRAVRASAPLRSRYFAAQGGVCFESGPEREHSPGKMATAGSAKRPGRPASAAAAGTSRARLAARCRSGSSPPKSESKKCAACAERNGSPAGGHLACPLCLALRQSGREERLRGRSDPGSSSSRPGRRDCDSTRGRCASRGNSSSHFAVSAPPLCV